LINIDWIRGGGVKAGEKNCLDRGVLMVT